MRRGVFSNDAGWTGRTTGRFIPEPFFRALALDSGENFPDDVDGFSDTLVYGQDVSPNVGTHTRVAPAKSSHERDGRTGRQWSGAELRT